MWKTYALVQSIAHLYVVLRLPATEADVDTCPMSGLSYTKEMGIDLLLSGLGARAATGPRVDEHGGRLRDDMTAPPR